MKLTKITTRLFTTTGQGAIEYLLIIGAAILIVSISIIAITGSISGGEKQVTQSNIESSNAYTTLRQSEPSLNPTGGLNQATAGASCKTIHETYSNFNDGVYWIDPNGGNTSDSIQVYCDMTLDDGGWTLAAICRELIPQALETALPQRSNCWNNNAVGTVIDPNSTTESKLSDTAIKNILTSGEKTTRGWWKQSSRHNPNLSGSYTPYTAAVFNRFTNPTILNSNGSGRNTTTAAFELKHTTAAGTNNDLAVLSNTAYAQNWTNIVWTTSCGSYSTGWSNTTANSCGYGAWMTDCEGGPSMSHNCNSNLGTAGDLAERANLILWIR